LFFFFSSRRRHTRSYGDWSSTCALPIFAGRGAVGAVQSLRQVSDLMNSANGTPSRNTKVMNRFELTSRLIAKLKHEEAVIGGIRSEERREGEVGGIRGEEGREGVTCGMR